MTQILQWYIWACCWFSGPFGELFQSTDLKDAYKDFLSGPMFRHYILVSHLARCWFVSSGFQHNRVSSPVCWLVPVLSSLVSMSVRDLSGDPLGLGCCVPATCRPSSRWLRGTAGCDCILIVSISTWAKTRLSQMSLSFTSYSRLTSVICRLFCSRQDHRNETLWALHLCLGALGLHPIMVRGRGHTVCVIAGCWFATRCRSVMLPFWGLTHFWKKAKLDQNKAN